jgi:hypothetical protein
MKMYTLWPPAEVYRPSTRIQHIRKVQCFASLCDAYFRYLKWEKGVGGGGWKYRSTLVGKIKKNSLEFQLYYINRES